ncbi:hypothetical protein [Acidibrevibacterium fodinaquatile]|uniref:hypothetical protein n=1 Tax=Acidibrevibacterium fodinaquatile TaxID=1969806 RepID=UPI0013B43F54|nr:hypothetical protein [Acidibrevibacterium fodinaquatile]
MAVPKGADLEELVRAYFARQGFFVLRSVSLRFEGEEVTDIDGWFYGRQSASIRTHTLIDVKDKRSPKAFERILWARGMQLALGCDRAIVATTDSTQKVARFAQQQKVGLLSKQFLDRLQNKLDLSERLTLEQFHDNIRKYPDHKQDGDWIRRIADAKSSLISLQGYPAFNKSMAAFRFFADRALTRPQHKEQALRCAYFVASLACIALDRALEHFLYEETASRFHAIAAGITYGDAGDAKVQKSIETVLSVIAEGMENGRVVARQAKQALEKLFENVRADIIAEYFVKEHNSSALFAAAKELEERAHQVDATQIQTLSVEAKSILGVFADFVQVKRGALISNSSAAKSDGPPRTSDRKSPVGESEAESNGQPEGDAAEPQSKLL